MAGGVYWSPYQSVVLERGPLRGRGAPTPSRDPLEVEVEELEKKAAEARQQYEQAEAEAQALEARTGQTSHPPRQAVADQHRKDVPSRPIGYYDGSSRSGNPYDYSHLQMGGSFGDMMRSVRRKGDQ